MVRALIVLLGMILLCGCAQPPSRVLPVSCETKCAQRYQHCAEVCYNSCPACKQRACASTAENYEIYVRMQHAQGAVVARELDSYRDSLSCMKVTCDCPTDYTLCKQVCHNQVKPVLGERFCSYPLPALDFE